MKTPYFSTTTVVIIAILAMALAFPTTEANLISVRGNGSFKVSEERKLKKKPKGSKELTAPKEPTALKEATVPKEAKASSKEAKGKKCKGKGQNTTYAENCDELKKQLLAIESQMVMATNKTKAKLMENPIVYSVISGGSATFGVDIQCELSSPSNAPSSAPSSEPSTAAPSSAPSPEPSTEPSSEPSTSPSSSPTETPVRRKLGKKDMTKELFSPCLDLKKQLQDLEDEMVCFVKKSAKKNHLKSQVEATMSEFNFGLDSSEPAGFGIAEFSCGVEE
jgi:hypothetical protein